ncbi:3Beta-HSD domain-containing protein [Mycena venus]|uniref:3Beta-HSD domain-containing protein n=1 Tax=Mycena venus TaxID=2733690 RepID=A0A8H7CCB1_9AGAR|nr:3Beta-HSD domain-containing protein [Mycena venus]
MSQDKPTHESYLVVGGGPVAEAVVKLLKPQNLAIAFGSMWAKLLPPKVVSDAIQSCQATCIIHTGIVSTPVITNITYPSVYTAPPTEAQRKEMLEEINVVMKRTSIDGTRNLISAIPKTTVKQLVYFGSADCTFDGTERPNMSEVDVPCLPQAWVPALEPRSFGERSVLNANGQNGLATAVIRPAFLFGPTFHSYMGLLRCQRTPHLSAVCVGDNTNISDTTFIDNAAHAGILAADRLTRAHPQHAATAGRAFFVSDDDPRPSWDLERDLWAAASHTTPPVPVRVPLSRFLRKPGPLARLRGRTGPRTEKEKNMHWFCATRTYDISLARDVLGYAPIVTHDEGIRRTAEWWLEKQRKLSALKNETQATIDNPPPAYDAKTQSN